MVRKDKWKGQTFEWGLRSHFEGSVRIEDAERQFP